MPTVTEVEVMPVWSLNALDGILEAVDEPPAAVVVVDVEFVEPQAIAVVASRSTRPAAASRVFPDVRVMSPLGGCACSGASIPHRFWRTA